MSMDNNPSRFTIHDETDEVSETPYETDAENLRIEKLGTRLTLVTILIPCLVTVMLAVAYLDIKNRVVSTQRSGSMGVQNLAKDLESRYENLLVKQTDLEQRLDENTKALETLSAGLKANLTKSIDEFKGKIDDKVSRGDLGALSKKTNTAIDELKKELVGLSASFDKFDDELAGQIQVISQGFEKDREVIENIEQKALQAEQKTLDLEEKTGQLEEQKLSRQSLKLSLDLERLALQELVKEKMRVVEKKITQLDKRIQSLDQKVKAQVEKTPVPRPTPVKAPKVKAPAASEVSTPSATPSSQPSPELEEINLD